MERDRSGFFSGLAGAGRGLSINPAAKAARAAKDEDESWEESTVEEGEEADFGVDLDDGEEGGVNDDDADAEADDDEEMEEGEEFPEEEGEEAPEDEGDDDDDAPKKKKSAPAASGAIDGVETVRIEAGQEQDKTSWLDIPLSKRIRHSVAECGWLMPTPVQCKTIPAAIEGYDVCCRAVTGSGKTGAFLLPILHNLSTVKQDKPGIRALVVLPTRELAVQCFNQLEQLAMGMSLTKSLVIGGLSVSAQTRELRNRPDIVICTPGRMIDSLRNAQGIALNTLEMLVFDEADRLLSLGFRDQIEELLRFCPNKRQTMLLSATMTREVNELATLTLEKPLNIDVGHVAVSQNLTQEFVRLPEGEKEDHERLPLLSCLVTHEFRRGVIIFCKSKSRAQRVRIVLDLQSVPCAELHQNLSQEERLGALNSFRDRTVSVLVTTEVASRGLDIEGVRTVINYDLPVDLTSYVHRVGRTARIGKNGRAVSFVGKEDVDLMKKVVKLSKLNAGAAGSAGASKVRQRVVEPERIAEKKSVVETLLPKIRERADRERLQRDIGKAERTISKQQNMLKHMEDIKARPKASWHVSELDKKTVKKRSREEMEEDARGDLDEYITGDLNNMRVYHAKQRKIGEFGAKTLRMEEMAEKVKAEPVKGDKYGKLYQPQRIEKPRGKSLKKANTSEWRAKRREAKETKLEKAAKRKGAGKKTSGKDKKKDWKFTERKSTFKSKKRYKRHK